MEHTNRLAKTLESIMTDLKPEAAYFASLDGKRGGMIFFNLSKPSQIVEVVEPFFLNLNAETEIVPVMNPDDLREGLSTPLPRSNPAYRDGAGSDFAARWRVFAFNPAKKRSKAD